MRRITSLFFITSLFIFSIMLSQSSHAAVISEARLWGVSENYYNEVIKPIKGRKNITATFTESFQKGSYRDIGRSHARFLMKINPQFKEHIITIMNIIAPQNSRARKTDVRQLEEQLRGFFPEILDEIEGFSEIVGIERHDALRFFSMYAASTGSRGNLLGNCSIFAVDKKKSSSGTPLVGRNYEWMAMYCDLSVLGTRPNGGYASVGCSHHYIGRLDGINEHGLFIGIMMSLSSKKNPDGFLFPIIVRAVLDKAKNMEEAIALLRRAPHSDSINYLVADRSGSAAVVEVIPGKPLSVRMRGDTDGGVLISTNHFQNNDTRGRNSFVMPNSYERLKILRRLLGKKDEKIGIGDVFRILTSARPNGVFWRTHDAGFGTLFSGAYDLAKGTWRLKVGQIEKEYTVHTDRNGSEEVVFENIPGNSFNDDKGGSVLDMTSLTGFTPVDQDSWYFNGTLSLYASDYIIYPCADLSIHYKKGILTEKTYGPHVDLSLFAQATGAYFKGGARLAFNPAPIFSLEITPFYLLSYPRSVQEKFTIKKRWEMPMEKISLIADPGLKGMQGSPGITINPIINISGFVTLENRLSFYFFKSTVFNAEHNMLLKKSFVWSPTLTVLIPYSKNFLWGIQGGGNIKVTLDKNDPYIGGKYNAFAGPVLVFPSIVDKLNLVVLGSYWIKRSDKNTRFYTIVSLQTQI